MARILNVPVSRRGLFTLTILALAISVLTFAVWRSLGRTGQNPTVGRMQKQGARSNDRKPQVDETFRNLHVEGFVSQQAESFAVTPRADELPPAEERISGKSFKDEEADEDGEKAENEIVKRSIPGLGADKAGKTFIDPLLRNNSKVAESAATMPSPILTFNGVIHTASTVLPPDANGDVGPNHYVQATNSENSGSTVIGVFDKSNGTRTAIFGLQSLFSFIPPFYDLCRTHDDGDPIVLYDQLADRWIISQFAVDDTTSTIASRQCIAVSATSDPARGYYIYTFAMPNGSTVGDYPHMGVWQDGYYMTTNDFSDSGSFIGAGVFAFDRDKLLAGDPTASYIFKDVATLDARAGGMLPSDIDGFVGPPTGLGELIMEFRADEFGDPLDAIRSYQFVPNFSNPAASTFAVLPDVPLAPFDARSPGSRNMIEQAGGTALDPIPDRLMYRLAYRNLGTQDSPVNSWVGNFTVNVSGVNPTSASSYQAGIRWFELHSSGTSVPPTAFDQGTHNLAPGNGPNGVNDWMGSVAQDNGGRLAAGFSQSSTGSRANIVIAGRTDGSGALNEGESTFFSASGSQGHPSGRWGDYSSMSVDPVDDCTFWYTQEYYSSSSSAIWNTRIGSFRFPTCTSAPKGTIVGGVTLCSANSTALVTDASITATGGYNRVTRVNQGTYSMTVSPGTYTMTAKKEGGFDVATRTNVVVTDGGTTTVNFCLTGYPLMQGAVVDDIRKQSCEPTKAGLDPGETVTVGLPVVNIGADTTVEDVGTLLVGGGVTDPGPPQLYGQVRADSTTFTTKAYFTFTIDPALLCGQDIKATVVHRDGNRELGKVVYSIPTGASDLPGITTTYSGPPTTIPDNDPAGVNIPITVSGLTSAISDVTLKIDGTQSSSDPNSTTVGLNHPHVGDIDLKLTSPFGKTVEILTAGGGDGACSLSNFYQLSMTDFGSRLGCSGGPQNLGPFSGEYRAPNLMYPSFRGGNPNGTWILNVSDNAPQNQGTLRAFSLIITTRKCFICEPTPTPTPTPTPMVPITVQTNPAGRSFTVDGTSYTTGQTFNWISGSLHTIETTTPQVTADTRYDWVSWNFGGAISHSIMPAAPGNYVANFSATPVSASATVTGKVLAPDGRGLRNAVVSIIDPELVKRTVLTNSFGIFRLESVIPGRQYTMSVNSKVYRFTSRIVQVDDSVTLADFVGQE